jgi:hemerythrin-like domain-containing protein
MSDFDDAAGGHRRRFLSTAALAAAALLLPGGEAEAEAEEKRVGRKGAPAAGEAEMGPTEDLMREHGVLRRVLLVYEEGGRRIQAHQALAPSVLNASAALIRRFVEGYHEKLEEEQVFPRLVRAHALEPLVATLKAQHAAGRAVTERILANTRPEAFAQDSQKAAVVRDLHAFIRMYRPHAAREDTVLFPRFRTLFDERTFDALGEQFEAQEHKLLGRGGFEGALAEVGQLEKEMGIADLAQFTPR